MVSELEDVVVVDSSKFLAELASRPALSRHSARPLRWGTEIGIETAADEECLAEVDKADELCQPGRMPKTKHGQIRSGA